MEMQELYYGRHGETFDLVAGVRSRPNTALTDEGRAQMKRAGELLLARGIKPSLIVCSELPRAVHSAEIIADVVDYDRSHIRRQSLLNERACGKAVGMLHTKIKKRWPGGYDTVPGAEGLQELQQRAAKAAAWLRKLESKVVLVIAHGTIGRAMVREFEGRPYTDEFANGRVSFGRGQMMRLHPLPTVALM
jgi:broad specificity phosphatase PhoE